MIHYYTTQNCFYPHQLHFDKFLPKIIINFVMLFYLTD